MRTFVISIVLLLCSTSAAAAQVRLVVQLGPSQARFEHETAVDNGAARVSKLGPMARGSFEYRGGAWLVPRLDLAYTNRGTEVLFLGESVEVLSLDYVDIAPLVTLERVRGRWAIHAVLGPELNVLARATEINADGTRVSRDNFSRLDVGLVGGLGASVRVSSAIVLSLEAKYEHGLRNVIVQDDDPMTGGEIFKNRTFSLVFGVGYELGGYDARWMAASFVAARRGEPERASRLRDRALAADRRRALADAAGVLVGEARAEDAELAYTWLANRRSGEFAREAFARAAERAFAVDDYARAAALDRVLLDNSSDVRDRGIPVQRRLRALVALGAWGDATADACAALEPGAVAEPDIAQTRLAVGRALDALSRQETVRAAPVRFADCALRFATLAAGETRTEPDGGGLGLVDSAGQMLLAVGDPGAIRLFTFILEEHPKYRSADRVAGHVLEALDAAVRAEHAAETWQSIAAWAERAGKHELFRAEPRRRRLALHGANADAGNDAEVLFQRGEDSADADAAGAAIAFEAIVAFHPSSQRRPASLYAAALHLGSDGHDRALGYLATYERENPKGPHVDAIPYRRGEVLAVRWSPDADPQGPVEPTPEQTAGLERAGREFARCAGNSRCRRAVPVALYVWKARVALFLGDADTATRSLNLAIRAYDRSNWSKRERHEQWAREARYRRGRLYLDPNGFSIATWRKLKRTVGNIVRNATVQFRRIPGKNTPQHTMSAYATAEFYLRIARKLRDTEQHSRLSKRNRERFAQWAEACAAGHYDRALASAGSADGSQRLRAIVDEISAARAKLPPEPGNCKLR